MKTQYRKYSAFYPGLLVVGIVPIHLLCFYWWSSGQYYFSGDALFYFSRPIDSFAQLASRFLTTDDLYQYRPLTYAFFSFVLRPLFASSPQPYHVVAYLFTALNGVLACACLYYWFERKAPLWCFASVFLLLNPVHFFPAFGPTYIDQWLSTMFYFVALLLIIRQPPYAGLAAPLLFVLALGSKEHSVTLPAHAVLLLVATNTSLRDALRRTRNLWIVLAGFLVFQLLIRQGALFAQAEVNPNLQFAFSASRLMELVRGTKAVIFYPENYALAASFGIGRSVRILWIVPCLLVIAMAIRRHPRLAVSGLAWFLIALTPIAFIQQQPFGRHYYIGLAGLAVVFGCALSSWRVMASTAPALALLTVTNVDLYERESWVAVGARNTKSYVAAIDSMTRETGRQVFYATGNSDKVFHWDVDRGRALPAVLDRDVSILFDSLGEQLPVEEMLHNRINVIRAVNGRIFDQLSNGQFPPSTDEELCGLMPFVQSSECAVLFRGRAIAMNSTAVVETPTGLPIFPVSEGFVTLSRTTVTFPHRRNFEIRQQLRVAPESRDGVSLQIHLQRGSEFEQVLSENLAPGELYDLDFECPESEADRIVVRVGSGPSRDEHGDWLIWEKNPIHRLRPTLDTGSARHE